MEKLKELLNYLEEKIDIDHVSKTRILTADCLEYKDTGRHLMKIGYPQSKFPRYSYRSTTTDMGKMLYNELESCIVCIEAKDDSLPMVRANYGVGTLPSLFGLHSRIVNDNLPWVDHIDDIDDVKRLVDKGIPDLDTGFGKRVIETYEYYNEILSEYPKCHEAIALYHADLQGPLDVSHLIMGSDIYYAIYDEPELVKELMKLVTETYILYLKRMKKYINDEWNDYCSHWGTLYAGKTVIRNDSTVNLSKDVYFEFVKPYDERILTELGSGSIHFCGRADQWVLDMTETKNLKALNFGYMPNLEFGQKYLEFIYPAYSEKKVGICAYTLDKSEIPAFDFEKYKKGITYQTSFDSLPEAEEYLASIR